MTVMKEKTGKFSVRMLDFQGSDGYDKEKILKAVENCVMAMGELTIAESKVARKHLDSVMEEMYKRSQDTLINTIQPRL